MSRLQSTLKRVVVGRPMSHGELEHTLLPKGLALPIFSSDALSSVAYATQEILLVLGLAGTMALQNVVPISVGVATLLAIVVISFRQTVRAYPSGGGAYIVAHGNLGVFPGLLAGGALLIDYVLTVSVSITAGAEAIVSAAPNLHDYKVQLAMTALVLVAVVNLRGVRESGAFFAIPTYGFVLSILLLIGTGVVRCIGGCPQAESADKVLEATSALTPFLILKAFSAGTTALTGVEAISNGVAAFRYPQSRNAATTLAVMGTTSISMFLGISWLAAHTHVRYEHGDPRSVVSQIADAVFGGGPMFFLVQIMTASILFLAANTAFTGFPQLSSILARDRFLPRQLMNRGDRLVFSNGIIILSLLAALLVNVFQADLNRLIQLYLVGVFTGFTLSQAGMVVHWRRSQERGWRRSLAINAIGGLATAVVLVVVVVTKFLDGAWIVVSAIPVVIFMMHSVHQHYRQVAVQLGAPERVPVDRRAGQQHMVILVTTVDAAVARAVGYVRAVRPAEVVAIATEPASGPAWGRLAPDIPLEILPQSRSRTKAVRNFLKARRDNLEPDTFLTLVVPEVLKRKGLLEILLHPRLHRLKAAFLSLRNVQVLDVPVLREAIDPRVDLAHEPARNIAVVLVSGVHNAALQAIEYAETLRPTSLRAVSIGLDPDATEKLGNRWLQAGVPHPLEIEDSPFRDIGASLSEYVRQFEADGVHRVVTVVIPEFVVRKRRHRVLHGQTALIVKRHLLFERGVVVASVPYHLEE